MISNLSFLKEIAVRPFHWLKYFFKAIVIFVSSLCLRLYRFYLRWYIFLRIFRRHSTFIRSCEKSLFLIFKMVKGFVVIATPIRKENILPNRLSPASQYERRIFSLAFAVNIHLRSHILAIDCKANTKGEYSPQSFIASKPM